MTIGPAPMMRIEEMSVRLGISLGELWAEGTKKGALFARPSGGAEAASPRAGRCLDQNDRGGKGGPGALNSLPLAVLSRFRHVALHRPRDECHARGIVADIGGRAASRKSASRKLGDHRRLAIAREPEVRAQSPIVGEESAQETDEGCAEKPVRSGKAKQRGRIGQGRDMR